MQGSIHPQIARIFFKWSFLSLKAFISQTACDRIHIILVAFECCYNVDVEH